MTIPSWGGVVRLPECAAAVLAARRALAALLDPARRPTPTPLVLHGPPGTGKSAVVRALVGKLTAAPAGLTARVLPARDLPTDADELADLTRVDLLALEDVHHLPARSAADLARLLDGRAARRLTTVITAPAGPAELTALPCRLTSRLCAGLVVPLDPLSPESRRVLIARHANRRRLALAPDALDWLAARPTGGGVRPALGLVERLAVLARGAADALDAATAERLLADPDPSESRGPVERIIDVVAARFKVKPADVVGSSRLRTAVVPRQVAMYLARDLTGLSLPRIAQAVGGRDHTTVLYACRKVAAGLAADPAFARLVDGLKGELR